MGRVLQIRVLAYTYNPEDVERAWPTLCDLAWALPRPASLKIGVLELTQALGDQVRFGELKPELKAALNDDTLKAQAIAEKLNAALADWNPRLANTLSDELEETLSGLEKAARK